MGVGGKEGSGLVCDVGRWGERRESSILHVFEGDCVRRRIDLLEIQKLTAHSHTPHTCMHTHTHKGAPII